MPLEIWGVKWALTYISTTRPLHQQHASASSATLTPCQTSFGHQFVWLIFRTPLSRASSSLYYVVGPFWEGGRVADLRRHTSPSTGRWQHHAFIASLENSMHRFKCGSPFRISVHITAALWQLLSADWWQLLGLGPWRQLFRRRSYLHQPSIVGR